METPAVRVCLPWVSAYVGLCVRWVLGASPSGWHLCTFSEQGPKGLALAHLSGAWYGQMWAVCCGSPGPPSSPVRRGH